MSTISNFREIVDKVNGWARQNATNDFYYGAPYSYWNEALHHNIITTEEYQQATIYYGNLWTYRGD